MLLIRNTFASSINVTGTSNWGVTRNGVFKRRLRVIAINSVCFGRPFACYGHDNEHFGDKGVEDYETMLMPVRG